MLDLLAHHRADKAAGAGASNAVGVIAADYINRPKGNDTGTSTELIAAIVDSNQF
ncbi:hypothetical protein SAZ11_48105 [Streptomyces sp. FXJ1.4098]|nr:hypothetical protein [Streptomyces sp. FXJ1.4098]